MIKFADNIIELTTENARLKAINSELLAAAKDALEALRNVPEVGKKYDAQHSHTQLAADQQLADVIRKAEAK